MVQLNPHEPTEMVGSVVFRVKDRRVGADNPGMRNLIVLSVALTLSACSANGYELTMSDSGFGNRVEMTAVSDVEHVTEAPSAPTGDVTVVTPTLVAAPVEIAPVAHVAVPVETAPAIAPVLTRDDLTLVHGMVQAAMDRANLRITSTADDYTVSQGTEAWVQGERAAVNPTADNTGLVAFISTPSLHIRIAEGALCEPQVESDYMVTGETLAHEIAHGEVWLAGLGLEHGGIHAQVTRQAVAMLRTHCAESSTR